MNGEEVDSGSLTVDAEKQLHGVEILWTGVLRIDRNVGLLIVPENGSAGEHDFLIGIQGGHEISVRINGFDFDHGDAVVAGLEPLPETL